MKAGHMAIQITLSQQKDGTFDGILREAKP